MFRIDNFTFTAVYTFNTNYEPKNISNYYADSSGERYPAKIELLGTDGS